MTKHTSNDPNVKDCCKGVYCVHPNGPRALPITEFYAFANGKTQRQCKECAKAYHRRYQKKHPRNSMKSMRETWRDSEQVAVDYLRAHGIYAVAGVASEWTWVDVVAWGCVRIEVKTSNPTPSGAYLFGLATKSRKNWHKNDLVMLVCHTPDGDTFHLFERDDPIFKRKNGQPKQNVQYNPDAKHRKTSLNALTPEIMSAAQDRIELIADRVKRWVQEA